MKHLAVALAFVLAFSLSAPLAAKPEPSDAPPAAPPPLATETEVELADHLPADTLLYARFPSLAAAWKGFRTLPLYQAWLDEEVQEFISASSEGFQKMFAGAGGDSRLLERILSLPETFPGEIAFSYLDPDPDSPWVISMSAPGDEKGVAKFAAEVVKPLLGAAAFSEATARLSSGITVTSYHSPTRTIDVAAAGSRLLIASGEGLMARLVRPASGSESRLSRYSPFRESMQKVGGSDLSFAFYVNIERALAEATKHGNDKDREMLEILGIAGTRSLAAGLRMADGRAKETIWLDRPGGRKGLYGIFPGVPVDHEIARLAPKNAFAVVAGSLNPSELYRLAFEISKGAERGPLHEFRQLDKSLAQAMGLEGLADLAGFFGTEVCLYAALPQGGGAFPELGAAIEVMKPDRLQMCLDALGKTLFGSKPKVLSYKGREVRYVKPDSSGFIPAIPCWCVTDGYLLVSHHPTILKSIIRRLDGKLDSMLDDESYVTATRALPDGTVGMVYLSTERLFRYLYSLALTFLPMAGDNLPFDTAALPTADAIARHLSFALSGLTLEEGGLMVRTDSDGYGPTSLGLYGSLAALFIESPWRAGREAATRYPACGGNLQRIHEFIAEYRSTNGRFPGALAELVEERNSWRAWSFRCHKAEQERNEELRAAGPRAPRPTSNEPHFEDFVYALAGHEGELPSELPETMMLIWDSEPRHNGGRIFVTVGGEIGWLLEDAFRKKLAEQKK